MAELMNICSLYHQLLNISLSNTTLLALVMNWRDSTVLDVPTIRFTTLICTDFVLTLTQREHDYLTFCVIYNNIDSETTYITF